MIRFSLWLAMAYFFLLNPVGAEESQGDIGVHERLGQEVPFNLTFYDEKGSPVRLGELINKPTILNLVYYHCSHICPQMLLGLSEVFSKLEMSPGKDYRVITLSFDETDTPEDARNQKINYLRAVNRPFPSAAWNFLTGDGENIGKISDALGIVYKRVMHGFVHPEVIVFLSPGGRITRYIYVSKFSYGVSYPITFSTVDFPKAITNAAVGITEAGARTTPLICFPHEPGLQERFFTILAVAGTVTLISLLSFFIYLRVTTKKAGGRE